jgi:lysozyme
MTSKQKLTAWVGAGAVASLVGFTSIKEGTILKTYRDPVNILTACTGETRFVVKPGDIVPGATFTRQQCEDRLIESLWEHAEPVIRCTAPAQLTQGQKIAFTDFAFNAGGANFCNSSMARKAKAGDVQGSCDALLQWRFAGGKDCALPGSNCAGIWIRRKEDHAICLR